MKDMERLIGIESQVRLLKWIFGITVTLIVGVTAYLYAQGSDISSLDQRIIYREKEAQKQESIIKVIVDKVGTIRGDIKVTKIHIQHINEVLQDIKEILKTQRK